MGKNLDPDSICDWRQDVEDLIERKPRIMEELRQAVPSSFLKWLEAEDEDSDAYIETLLNELFLLGVSSYTYKKCDWKKHGPDGWKQIFKHFKTLETAWQGNIEVETVAEGQLFEEEGVITVTISIPNSSVGSLSLES